MFFQLLLFAPLAISKVSVRVSVCGVPAGKVPALAKVKTVLFSAAVPGTVVVPFFSVSVTPERLEGNVTTTSYAVVTSLTVLPV